MKNIERLVQTAQEVDLSVERIVIELSERTQWTTESLEVLRTLKEKYKFYLALDDFGAGFSNSALLLEIEPNIVKIDRYFIQKIHENERKYNLVKSFIHLLRVSDTQIACEGIEEEEELELLKSLGSDYGQGYYLGKPE